MPTVEVQLLGRFSVAVDGVPISGDAWRSRRAADVVKLLALAPAHRMHRLEVMEALWPDSDPEASGNNLRKALHFARLATGDEHPEPDVIGHKHPRGRELPPRQRVEERGSDFAGLCAHPCRTG